MSTGKKVRVIVPGGEYPWTPEGYDTVFYLRILAPTTVRRILMEAAARVGYEPSLVPNPEPGEGKPGYVVDIRTQEAQRYIMEAATEFAKEALIRWENVEDMDGNEVSYDPSKPELLEYIADVNVLDMLYLEIQNKSVTVLGNEKKSFESTVDGTSRMS